MASEQTHLKWCAVLSVVVAHDALDRAHRRAKTRSDEVPRLPAAKAGLHALLAEECVRIHDELLLAR
jgi:hypothetical protein